MNIFKLICYVYIFFGIGSFYLLEVFFFLMFLESCFDLEDFNKNVFGWLEYFCFIYKLFIL